MKLRNSKNEDSKDIIRLVIGQMVDVFPYALVIYLAVVTVSVWSVQLRSVINWPSLHGVMVIILLLTSIGLRQNKISPWRYLKLALDYPTSAARYISKWSTSKKIALAVSTVIVVSAALSGMNALSLAVLVYALASVLFQATDIRLTLILLVGLLVLGLLTSIFQLKNATEFFAIHALYLMFVLFIEQLFIGLRKV